MEDVVDGLDDDGGSAPTRSWDPVGVVTEGLGVEDISFGDSPGAPELPPESRLGSRISEGCGEVAGERSGEYGLSGHAGERRDHRQAGADVVDSEFSGPVQGVPLGEPESVDHHEQDLGSVVDALCEVVGDAVQRHARRCGEQRRAVGRAQPATEVVVELFPCLPGRIRTGWRSRTGGDSGPDLPPPWCRLEPAGQVAGRRGWAASRSAISRSGSGPAGPGDGRRSAVAGRRRRITAAASCWTSHGRSVAAVNSAEQTTTSRCGSAGCRRTSRSQAQRRPTQSETRRISMLTPSVAVEYSSSRPSGSSTTVAPDGRVKASPSWEASQPLTALPGRAGAGGRRAG